MEDFGLLYWENAPYLALVVLLYILVRRADRRVVWVVKDLVAEHPRFAARTFLSLFCLTALGIAALRPHAGKERVDVAQRGQDILVLLDVSNSMLSSDASPDRLGLARRKIFDLIEILETQGKSARVGISVFAGEWKMVCPLTSDLDVVRSYLRVLGPHLVSRGGSDIQGALRSASDHFISRSLSFPLFLLLTDGEETLTVQRPGPVASGISLGVLGIGETEARPIEISRGRFLRDRSGQIVLSALKEDSLRALAENEGGTYVRARVDESDLLHLLATEGSEAELGAAQSVVLRELAPILATGILALWTCAALFGRIGVFFPVVLCCVLVRVSAAEDWSPHDAWKAYHEGRYADAAAAFQDLQSQDPENPRILQGLGSSYYKLEQFEEARKFFEAAARASATAERKFDAEYNLGNTYAALGRYKEAVEAYDRALSVFPDNIFAAENRAFVLEASRRTPTPTPTPESRTEEQRQNPKGEPPTPAPAVSPAAPTSKPEEKNAEKSGDEERKEQPDSSTTPGAGTPGPGATPAPTPLERREGNEGSEPHDDSPLTDSESERWLRSLPDAPVAARRPREGGQDITTW